MGTIKQGCEAITFKLSMILTKEDLDRISLRKEGEDNTVLTADLHNMRRKEAERFINNLIALNQEPFELDLIHGYNHGTVLRDMIHKGLDNPRIKSRTLLLWNEGETLLTIN